MSALIAALPMYDWPERRAEVDAEWADIRDRLRAHGIDAPDALTRRNADMPAVPGGIRDAAGRTIAPDPATLAPDEFDLATLWRHPGLLFAQTCWGPMETTGLAVHVAVIGQPDYSGVEGGAGELYSSAIVMRGNGDVAAPSDGRVLLPLDRLSGCRLAFNSAESMSGILGLTRDLDAAGEGLAMFSVRIETGGHRASALAVARGDADVAALDCRSWNLFRRFEPEAAKAIHVAGWTARRKGLPYVGSRAVWGAVRQPFSLFF